MGGYFVCFGSLVGWLLQLFWLVCWVAARLFWFVGWLVVLAGCLGGCLGFLLVIWLFLLLLLDDCFLWLFCLVSFSFFVVLLASWLP